MTPEPDLSSKADFVQRALNLECVSISLTFSVLEHVEMLLVDDHTLQTPAENEQLDLTFHRLKLEHDEAILFKKEAKPLFLDDELAKASLVSPTVVGRDGRVAGALIFLISHKN